MPLKAKLLACICGSFCEKASDAELVGTDGVGVNKEVTPSIATLVTIELAIPPTTGKAPIAVTPVPIAPATVPTAPTTLPTTGIADTAVATAAAPPEIPPKTAATAGIEPYATGIIYISSSPFRCNKSSGISCLPILIL